MIVSVLDLSVGDVLDTGRIVGIDESSGAVRVLVESTYGAVSHSLSFDHDDIVNVVE